MTTISHKEAGCRVIHLADGASLLLDPIAGEVVRILTVANIQFTADGWGYLASAASGNEPAATQWVKELLKEAMYHKYDHDNDYDFQHAHHYQCVFTILIVTMTIIMIMIIITAWLATGTHSGGSSFAALQISAGLRSSRGSPKPAIQTCC